MIIKSKHVAELVKSTHGVSFFVGADQTEFTGDTIESKVDSHKCQIGLYHKKPSTEHFHKSETSADSPCACAYIELIKFILILDPQAQVTCAGLFCTVSVSGWEKSLHQLIPCQGIQDEKKKLNLKKLIILDAPNLKKLIIPDAPDAPKKPKTIKSYSSYLLSETVNFPGEYAEVPGELEFIPIAGKSNLVRSIHGAVFNFYALEEASLSESLPTVFRDRHKEFVDSTARTMFDYLATICMSEARHAGDTTWNVYGINNQHKSRSNAWSMGRNYNPRQSLKVCEYLFTHASYPGGYGGTAWAKIAHCAGRYFDLPVRSWFDHVVDLAHNGGLAFNKGVFWYNPINNNYYISMLNRRKKGSVFDNESAQHFASTHGEQKWLLYCGGLLDEPGPKIPRLRWGTQLVECVMGVQGAGGDIEDGSSPELDVTLKATRIL